VFPDIFVRRVGSSWGVNASAFGFVLDLFLFRARLQPPRDIEQVKVVAVDQGDQSVGIGRVGGVTASLEAFCPPFVIGWIQVKQPGVSVPEQEMAVVLVTVLGILVHAETLSFLVVVVVGSSARPSRVAFDAKVVVGPLCQLTHPVATFQNALGQGDAGRDAIALHLHHRFVLPLLDVRFLGGGRFGPLHVALGVSQTSCCLRCCHHAGIQKNSKSQPHQGAGCDGDGGQEDVLHGAWVGRS
jgi:hypothetical protein